MKKIKTLGLRIGAIFCVVSFLFTFTIGIPMFSVFPSEFLNQAVSGVFPSLSHEASSIITIVLLFILFAVAIFFTLKIIKNLANEREKLKVSETVVIMSIFYFIIHNLGYYFLLGISGFPIDALNTLMAVVSFPFSSLLFLAIGYLMDWYWKRVSVSETADLNGNMAN